MTKANHEISIRYQQLPNHNQKKDATLAAPFFCEYLTIIYIFNSFPLLTWVSVANSSKYIPAGNVERSTL